MVLTSNDTYRQWYLQAMILTNEQCSLQMIRCRLQGRSVTVRGWLGCTIKVHAFRQLPTILEEIQKLPLMVQDEWEFCLGLHLHPGGRPLFNPGCRCRSRNGLALRIHISPVKFRCITRVSTDPTVELKQTKSPNFENMSIYTWIPVTNLYHRDLGYF
jgi:hypothetical protein